MNTATPQLTEILAAASHVLCERTHGRNEAHAFIHVNWRVGKTVVLDFVVDDHEL